jgi:hypothetical protein
MAHTNITYVHVDHKNNKNYNPIEAVALLITTDKVKYTFVPHHKNEGQKNTIETVQQTL